MSNKPRATALPIVGILLMDKKKQGLKKVIKRSKDSRWETRVDNNFSEIRKQKAEALQQIYYRKK